MSQFFRVSAFLLAGLLTLPACGTSAKDQNYLSQKVLGFYGSVVGTTWSAGCEHFAEGTDSSETIASFSKDTFVITVRTYSDTACRKPLGEGRASFAFIIFESNISGEVANLDLSLRDVTFLPQDQQRVDEANEKGECGKKDWTLGQAKTVLGLQCGWLSIPGPETRIYTVFSIVGDQIEYGDMDSSKKFDGSTPEKRPVHLKRSNFKKLN